MVKYYGLFICHIFVTNTVVSSLGIIKQRDGLSYEDVVYRINALILHEAERSGVQKFMYVSAFKRDKPQKNKNLYLQHMKHQF